VKHPQTLRIPSANKHPRKRGINCLSLFAMMHSFPLSIVRINPSAGKKQGVSMVCVALFDEVDEGTAIFKCTNDPPDRLSRFVTFEGVLGDFHLRMTGRAARIIRGDAPLSAPDFRETQSLESAELLLVLAFRFARRHLCNFA
jgi:hypothetical protein